jgi:hypothetical protein
MRANRRWGEGGIPGCLAHDSCTEGCTSRTPGRTTENVGAFDEGQRVRERYLETTYGVRVVFLVECIRASVYLS